MTINSPIKINKSNWKIPLVLPLLLFVVSLLSAKDTITAGTQGDNLPDLQGCVNNITVSNNMDSGLGSLRQAVTDICPNGTIAFDAVYTIDFVSIIQIDKDMTIDGSGQIFTSSHNSGIFEIALNSRLFIKEFTIKDTSTTNGSIINFGTLFIEDSYFANNTNTSSAGGGAISNFGSGGILRSSFYQNNAAQGGVIHNSSSSQSFSFKNSTMYQNGNLNTSEGGAIYSESSLVLRSVTIIDSGDGGFDTGNSIYLTGVNSVLQIDNTLVASANPSSSECALINGAIVTTDPNSVNYLIDDGSCHATFSGDPEVGIWGNYGGFAPTIPLLDGSPMINAGSELYCSLIGFLGDQLGNLRTQGIACDVGAVEFVDTIFPEVINVAINNHNINKCQSYTDTVNQIQVTFSERVLNAENINNYQFIQSGPDQSFQTADDVIIDVISAISDNHQDTPTVTIITTETITDGLIRLVIDKNITDEFYIHLNNNIEYVHQFRIEIGNLISGGHFDDCPNASMFPDWQIVGMPVILGLDSDQSNASFSFTKSVTNIDAISLKQCINLNTSVGLLLGASYKNLASSFVIEMSCTLYDDIACLGNIVNILSDTTTNFSSNGQWVNMSKNLGDIPALTQSSECKIFVTPEQNNPTDFLIDKVKLLLLDNPVFKNGFEG